MLSVWITAVTRYAKLNAELLAKLARYGIIGVISGIVYAAVTTILIVRFALAPVPASVGGYFASVPLGFLGHRRFSFKSRGRWGGEALRFVVTQALNISIAILAMYGATVWVGSRYTWGMLAAVILVPVVNFAVLNLWVFRDQDELASIKRKPAA